MKEITDILVSNRNCWTRRVTVKSDDHMLYESSATLVSQTVMNFESTVNVLLFADMILTWAVHRC